MSTGPRDWSRSCGHEEEDVGVVGSASAAGRPFGAGKFQLAAPRRWWPSEALLFPCGAIRRSGHPRRRHQHQKAHPAHFRQEHIRLIWMWRHLWKIWIWRAFQLFFKCGGFGNFAAKRLALRNRTQKTLDREFQGLSIGMLIYKIWCKLSELWVNLVSRL